MPNYTTDQGQTEDNNKYKTFEVYLLYNWQTGEIKKYSTESRARNNKGPYHVMRKLQDKIIMPSNDMWKTKTELEMSQEEKEEIAAEKI